MPSWAESLIGLVSGGGLLAILSFFFEHKKTKQGEKNRNIDDRISFWENVAKMNEDRISKLEKKINMYNISLKTLENHISVLEHIIVRLDPDAELPRRPDLPILNGDS